MRDVGHETLVLFQGAAVLDRHALGHLLGLLGCTDRRYKIKTKEEQRVCGYAIEDMML